jgi:CRP-like cAMP-binding protein
LLLAIESKSQSTAKAVDPISFFFLDSKEGKVQRRRIRNRLSAQFHRERKRTYIAHLEGLVKQRDIKLQEAAAALDNLAADNARLHALLALLVRRLGRRCGDWCDLPFRLTHERIGELIGTTRVTTTRLISRIRAAQLIEVPSGEAGLRLAPALVESAPLAAG